MKIVCVATEDPEFASGDEAITAALPLLMPFIRRAYREMRTRETDRLGPAAPADRTLIA
jgi:hypothetical protein